MKTRVIVPKLGYKKPKGQDSAQNVTPDGVSSDIDSLFLIEESILNGIKSYSHTYTKFLESKGLLKHLESTNGYPRGSIYSSSQSAERCGSIPQDIAYRAS